MILLISVRALAIGHFTSLKICRIKGPYHLTYSRSAKYSSRRAP